MSDETAKFIGKLFIVRQSAIAVREGSYVLFLGASYESLPIYKYSVLHKGRIENIKSYYNFSEWFRACD